MSLALVHAVGDRLGECELTFLHRQRIDVARARTQHAAYCDLLRRCGIEVVVLDVSPEHPDAVFIEDTAVVLDELVVGASMGTPARRGEVEPVLASLARGRTVRLDLPAALEGGDVLRVDRTLVVGRSPRTNAAGVEAFTEAVTPLGYEVVEVHVHGCLHLKTACTALDDHTLLVNPEWVDVAAVADFDLVPVAGGEPFAANVLRLRDVLVASASHPRTLARLRAAGHDVAPVDISELEKAEAGVTCLSLLLP